MSYFNKTKGKGNKNKDKGVRFERRVWKHLEEQGYYIKRSYASQGPADLFAMKKKGKLTELLLIQCKNLKIGYAPLSQEEIDGLIEIAKITGGYPFHVYNDLKHKIQFKEIKF